MKYTDLKKILINLDDWIIYYNIYNQKQINRYTDSVLIDHLLEFLKNEVKDTEFKFIKDKLFLPLQDKSSPPVDELSKLKNIILEIYGEDLGKIILEKLNKQINKLT
jgi:hypothetical protein